MRRKTFTKVTILFTITYGIKSLTSFYYGNYYKIFNDYFTRALLRDLMYLLWDVPIIMSMLYLNW